MSLIEESALPELLSQVNQLPYEYADGDGIEFEPYDSFLSADNMSHWFKAWTGNPYADASRFRVLGQDGTGGYVAFSTVRSTSYLLAQPIVFMGSEGETAILARNFYDYLWLLAEELGPCEATSYPDVPRISQPELEAFALKNAASVRKAAQVLQDARAEFPRFVQDVEAQCR